MPQGLSGVGRKLADSERQMTRRNVVCLFCTLCGTVSMIGLYYRRNVGKVKE